MPTAFKTLSRQNYAFLRYLIIRFLSKDFWSILPTLGKSNQKTKKEIQEETMLFKKQKTGFFMNRFCC